MKLRTEQPYLSPRVLVVAHLRPAAVSPEIWPLKVVAMIALFVIGLSAVCAWLNDQAARAAEAVVTRIEEAQARIDADQRAQCIATSGEGAGR